MADQTLPGRGSGRSTEGIYGDCEQDFQKGNGDRYWHQRLSLGQPYTVPHKTAEQGLYGVCLYNNKLCCSFCSKRFASLVLDSCIFFESYFWRIK